MVSIRGLWESTETLEVDAGYTLLQPLLHQALKLATSLFSYGRSRQTGSFVVWAS